MAQLNVSLPDNLKTVVDRAVGSGNYASASDYIRDLIRRDIERREYLDWLESEIERGFASGVSSRSIEDIIADRQAKLAAA